MSSLTLPASTLSFPLAQVPSHSDIREKEDHLGVEDAHTFVTSVVEEVEFDYALCGKVNGRIPGLVEEEEDASPFIPMDERESLFSPSPDSEDLDNYHYADPFREEEENGNDPYDPDPKTRFVRVRAKASKLEGDASVFAQLLRHGLLSKLTQIVLLKAKVPAHLRDEAAQEVQVTWSLLRAHPDFARNQMARYAYLSGEHAALKVMRQIGAVVALPSSLFSKTAKDVKGANAKFLQYIGAATNPYDIDDYSDSIEVSDALVDSWEREIVSLNFFETQMQDIEVKPKQYKIARMFLVDRLTVDDIAEALKLTVKYVERSMHLVADALNARTDRKAKVRKTQQERRRGSLKSKISNGSEEVLFKKKATVVTEVEPLRQRKQLNYGDDDMAVVEASNGFNNDLEGIDDGMRTRPAWDIAEGIPDLYEEVPIEDDTPRRPARFKDDPALAQIQGEDDLSFFEDGVVSVNDVKALISISEKAHRTAPKDDPVVAVDALAVDHFDFEYEEIY